MNKQYCKYCTTSKIPDFSNYVCYDISWCVDGSFSKFCNSCWHCLVRTWVGHCLLSGKCAATGMSIVLYDKSNVSGAPLLPIHSATVLPKSGNTVNGLRAEGKYILLPKIELFYQPIWAQYRTSMSCEAQFLLRWIQLQRLCAQLVSFYKTLHCYLWYIVHTANAQFAYKVDVHVWIWHIPTNTYKH